MSTTWQLIAKQIGNNPDSTCIVYEDKSLTYRELDVLSQKLAHHLTQLESFRLNPLVPLYLERSLWFPVVVCGIWRAGGVYVPIDPLQPKDRLIQVLEDTSAAFIFTDKEHEQSDCRVEQHLIENIFDQTGFNTALEPRSNSLAYVLFTSGSTGIPKGVQISHKALLNHLQSIKSFWAYDKPPVGAALTPFVFDVSVWEMFSVLTEGGILHILPSEYSYQATELLERVINRQIDQLYIPPGMVPEIARKATEEQITLPLKRILFGVEPLKPEHFLSIRDACTDAVLLNGYGPTEATVCCTVFPFRGDHHPYERVPIGWAMPGYQIKLVGEPNYTPGLGELGEIWVGGDSVSDGYLHDDALNARLFHTDEHGVRWFKTGDLALQMEDGALIFSGRSDRQIKIRGYKVEPIEIELTINKYPGIDDSAVIQMTNENGFKYLVAFAGSFVADEILPDQVMWFIADRLPDYMIPSKVTIMKSLPRNLSGKIDRSALIDMHQAGRLQAQQPETDLEKKILKCWKEVLKREDIGITDSYFQFGANSLSAARIAAKIEVKTGKQCRIGLLSKYPTVQLLARKLEASGLDYVKDEHVAQLLKDRIPVTPTQEELLFLHEVDPDGRTHNILTRFEIKSACDPECLMQAIKNFIERQPSLHLKFLRDQGQWYQEPIKGFRCQLPFRSIVDEDEAEQKRIVGQTVQQVGRIAFDIFKGPLQSGFLLQLEPDRYEFIWSVHHLIFDGWSMSIMLRGIRDAIGGKLMDQPVPYAGWIGENLQQFRQTTPNQIEKRINQLEPFAYPLSLPVISQGYSNLVTDGARNWFIIPTELQQQLEKMALASGSTLFNLLYTAYGLLLSLYSGKSSFMIGTPYANRHTALADQVTGYGITVLPLGFKADFNASFDDNLHANSRYTEEGYDLTYVAPGQIVKPLNKKVPGHSGSLLQAMFILQNWEHHEEPEGPVKLVQTDVGNQTAKMLITLNAEQVATGLECWFEYQMRQLDKEQVDRMATEFVSLLQHIVIDPHQTLKQIRDHFAGRMPVVTSHPSAAFISETSLGLWAMKHWLDEGGTLAAVMSNHTDTLKFARENGIMIISYGRKNLSQFKELGIDYLFSIVNSFILKPDILEVPRLGAINYHDSPLPELAGVYATSWALLEGRNEHAISWHYMVPGTDEGDLIVQKKFALEPGITVFELDTICYEKAQTGFREMVEMMHKGKPEGKKQHGKGSYNGLHKKPPLGGIVSFDRPGEQIISQYRALAFNARYPNPLCSLKIPFGDDCIYPQKILFVAGKAADLPGTLISHDARKLVFSCTNGSIEVLGAETRMRQPVDHVRLASLWKQTDMLTTQDLMDTRICLWLEKLSAREKRWVNFFENQTEPVNLEPLPPEPDCFTDEISLEGLSDHALAIAITVFLRMVDPTYSFGIAVSTGSLSPFQKMLTETILPFQFGKFDPDDFITMFEEASQKILEATPEHAYLKDIFYRYPQLRSEGWNGPQYHWTLYPGSAGDGHMEVGDIHILNGRVRVRQARVKGRFIDVPEWSYRFSRLAQFFNPERFGDIIPDDVLFLPAEKAEIMPEIVWGYRSLGDWFVEMALTWPDKPALVQDDRRLTFDGTLMMVRRIAYALRQEDTGSHTIAVSIERSPEAIIAQLAIYMLGYTYVPIDPHNPESRIRYVLEKSKPALMLTTRELYPDLKPL